MRNARLTESFRQEMFNASMRRCVDELAPIVLYKLAFLYLYNNDSSNCFNTMDMIPQLTNLSDEQVIDYNDYTSLVEFLWPVVRDTLTIDSTMATQLENITARESRPGSLARNVLIANDFMDYFEPIYLSDNLKSSMVNIRKSKDHIQKSSKLNVFPNPAKGYIIVSYDLTGLIGDFQVIVSSIEGRPLIQQNITGVKNQIVIPTQQYPSSQYYLHLINENTVIESLKFIILK